MNTDLFDSVEHPENTR